MKHTNKKGFTIVELVIVIAVIAILAAVLIPNLSRLVTKADKSAAMQEAKAAMDNDLINAEGDLANMGTHVVDNKQYYVVAELSAAPSTFDSEKVYMATYTVTSGESTTSEKKIVSQSSNVPEGATNVKYYEVAAYEGKYTVTNEVGTYEYTTKNQKFVCKLVTGGEWVIDEK